MNDMLYRPAPDDLTPEAGDLRSALSTVPAPRFQYAADPAEDTFARACVVTPSLLNAYRLAGYTGGLEAATKLRSAPRIEERVVYYASVQAAKLNITDERILAELAAIAFSDPAEFHELDGSKIENIHDLPRHARSAIKNISDTTRTVVTPDGDTITERNSHIQLHDKMKALEQLTRIKKMAEDPDAGKQAPTVIIDMSAYATEQSQAEQPLPEPEFPWE